MLHQQGKAPIPLLNRKKLSSLHPRTLSSSECAPAPCTDVLDSRRMSFHHMLMSTYVCSGRSGFASATPRMLLGRVTHVWPGAMDDYPGGEREGGVVVVDRPATAEACCAVAVNPATSVRRQNGPSPLFPQPSMHARPSVRPSPRPRLNGARTSPVGRGRWQLGLEAAAAAAWRPFLSAVVLFLQHAPYTFHATSFLHPPVGPAAPSVGTRIT